METDFKVKEKELFEGSSDNNNFWKVGITQENYKNFIENQKSLFYFNFEMPRIKVNINNYKEK